MKFKYYDILSHLIPGYLILVTINILFKESIPQVSIVPQIAIAFILGYFNNALASWFENVYWFLWGGNLVHKFFDKTGIWKVRFFKGKDVKVILKSKVCNNKANKVFFDESKDDKAKNRILFIEAMRVANNFSTERLNDLNASYSFARGILTSIFICSLFLVQQHYSNWVVYLIALLVLIMSLIRCKQRNGYYIREVLNIAYNKSVEESK